MKVPLQLKRRGATDPAVALLFLGSEAIELFRLCARLELDPTGRIHPVDGGFLIKLDGPSTQPLPGVVRLRRPSINLYVPVDAELVPALLDDEAEGLVQGRALVFPPWGGVLSFDPRYPLDLSRWLTADAAPRLTWHPFPERIVLAERIEEILLELPHESPETWLEAGETGIGTEVPRPDEAGPISTMAGKATLGAGRSLIWLGQALGLKGLARLGAGWVGGAMNLAPRLSEAVLGRQAAALRSLLREFREGDLEMALRRALPLGEADHGRRESVGTEDQLPLNAFAYSLSELLGMSSRKPARVWLGADDVLNELKREYRKAAEEAERRGDSRRAALIYGKLLKDFRMAAHALSRAELHHDAAILLLTKLEDWRGAAREFEAAGEIDRALRFYQQAEDHEAAGDLLVRVGDMDDALIEYQRAAERLVTSEGGHLSAGRLLASKAKRPDLALAHYLVGWNQRPQGNAVACLIEATNQYAEAGSTRSIIGLLDEADAYLADKRVIGAEWDRYYHDLARLAGRPSLESIRGELHDRARLGLAARLRELAKTGSPPGRIVSEVFGKLGIWPTALVRDAEFAVRAVANKAGPLPRERTSKRGETRKNKLGTSLVTAACSAPGSDDLFLGFEAGDVYGYRPERNEIVLVASDPHPVTALAASSDGQSLVVLRSIGQDSGVLSSYAASPDGTYRLILGMTVDDLSGPWLTPILTVDGVELVGVWDGQAIYYLTVRTLTSWGSSSLTRPDADPPAGLLVARPGKTGLPFSLLIHDGREWCLVEPTGTTRHATGLVWRPSQAQGNSLRSVMLAWNQSDAEHLELVGLDREGALFWSALRFEEGLLDLVASNRSLRSRPCLAATLVRSRLVAAVTASQVEWLRCGADRFTVTHSTRVEIPEAIACFPSRRTGELIVVSRDGCLERIAVPC
ncbi:tetratricopeptide repeat protein [Singulisphaera acidiphila]|uniref:MoxR-vWA-beta-propeller ternary system domain-containing protein n=1 Tax=Singulisphaera acidiphila (strain ATCC BAA-1392 / DSM 18658 / VKM B-2454 / MOB10) TaxID=886293 RepID=L0DB42_SINAD|nr:tetratricopeptide repeat protein [Singulisphaera acidiphila]AGA26452.1 hypothetical protein Sinac_2117 [Singulisphaera acidiphila DSM 18658]